MNGLADVIPASTVLSDITPSPCVAKPLQPFIQGKLDGLCGLYSLLNSARCADSELRFSTCKAMFRDSLSWLCEYGYLPTALYEGIPATALLSLHKRVIRRRRPGLKLERPFLRRKPETDEEFWTTMSSLLEKPRRSLIVGIRAKSWSHWTVINRITAGQIHFFDSDDLVWIRRRSCTCLRDGPGTHFIDPAEVFLIEAGKRRQASPRKRKWPAATEGDRPKDALT